MKIDFPGVPDDCPPPPVVLSPILNLEYVLIPCLCFANIDSDELSLSFNPHHK